MTTIERPKKVSDIEQLAASLDAASHDERLKWMYSLGRGDMKALFALARGQQLTMEPFSSSDVVICKGKNSLLLFNRFEKRFAQVEHHIVGYNVSGRIGTFVGGPGHFMGYGSPEVGGEIWIDYCKLPQTTHELFPPLRSNTKGLARLVYGNLLDIVRRVSKHILIGDSFKKGKPVGVLFTLCLPQDDSATEPTSDS
jgi:hypothetical protein